jgi:dTDP-glucose pyrophosphorylase
VPAAADLRVALAAIDRARMGLALVVDSGDRLLGTITDGDMRRALLRGLSLDACVVEVMNAGCATAGPSDSIATVLDVMQGRSIKLVPLVDESRVVQGVYFLPDLVGPVTRPNWAVIMAGGEGRRLWPLTAQRPKPMLPVGDRPLLENTLALLVAHGFRHIFISVNYLADQIEKHVGNGERFGCDVSYLREEEPLGTAGALSLLPSAPAAPMLVLNGDLLTDVDLSALMDYHQQAGLLATQCVREYVIQIPYGVVECRHGEVERIQEKPVERFLINAGIYVLAPRALGHLRAGPSTMVDLLDAARSSGERVAAFPIRERWTDIGQREDYERAQELWTESETS